MSFWTFVFLCVVAGLVYDLVRKKHLAKYGHWEDKAGQIQPLAAPHSGHELELEREVADLRERIKVLERIATDDHESRRLSAEIDQLRDK